MTKALALAFLLAAAPAAFAVEAPQGGQMLNLSVMEALVSIDQARLAGVFSFIPEKDSVSAFADLLAHDQTLLKKFTAKVEADLKAAMGVSQFDKDALGTVVALYGSPIGGTLPKTKPKEITRLAELAQAPAMSLEQISARRGKR